MPKKPYPGFPPNLTSIHTIGGYHRKCMVLELLTLDEVKPQEESQIYEVLELAIEKVLKDRHNIEKFKLISQDCFDTLLLDGLRLRKA